eukprot:scaffold2306_cov132-Cylindrotheca_fusiformis.AAC.8
MPGPTRIKMLEKLKPACRVRWGTGLNQSRVPSSCSAKAKAFAPTGSELRLLPASCSAVAHSFMPVCRKTLRVRLLRHGSLARALARIDYVDSRVLVDLSNLD